MDNPTPNTNKKKIGLISKIIIFFSVLGCLAAAAVILVYGYYNQQVNKVITVAGSDHITFTIEKGMGIKAISKVLYEKKLIEYPELLQAYMYLNPTKAIQAGYYTIELKDKSLADLVDDLQKGSFEKKLTFLEGWRKEEYIDYLKKEMGDEYASRFASSKYIKEGYLFPDTYIIDKDYSADKLASWMRNNFDKKFTPEMIDTAGLKGLSQNDVVILASIIEREMNNHNERPHIAGILIKRLKAGWAIQADATIQYAKGNKSDWWPVVTRDDYKNFESPYNTYLNKGLPPAPISNPGLSSIQAVVDFEDNPYWFYITGKDGKTYYAKTIEEHNENVAKYLK